jgi:hypothetical protein
MSCLISRLPLLLGLLGTGLGAAAQSTHTFVVARAGSRQPLPAVTVQAGGQTLRTDEYGRFTTAAPPPRLRLSCVGYQARELTPTASTDTLWLQPQTVQLVGVQVRAKTRTLLWQLPGHARWPHDAYSNNLTPGLAAAVQFVPADTAHRYRVRAIRLRLGSRFPENAAGLSQERRHFDHGRLRVRMLAVGAPGPAEQDLLPPLLITPVLSAQHRHGWLRLDVSAANVLVPAAGLFVAAEGLTTQDAERLLRARRVLYSKQGGPPVDYDPQKHGPRGTISYQEVEPADSVGVKRLIRSTSYPALGHRSTTDADCRSWHRVGPQGRWEQITEYCRQLRAIFPQNEYSSYNYDLELEVEEL